MLVWLCLPCLSALVHEHTTAGHFNSLFQFTEKCTHVYRSTYNTFSAHAFGNAIILAYCIIKVSPTPIEKLQPNGGLVLPQFGI